MYVWVPPDGVDELTKVTLLIEDIAYYEPQRVGQKVTVSQASLPSGGGGRGVTAREESDKSTIEKKTTMNAKNTYEIFGVPVYVSKSLVTIPEPEPTTTITTTTTMLPQQPTAFPGGVLGIQQQLQMAPSTPVTIAP